MNRRKLEALRALAERPGTAAEGALAREILDRAESKRPDVPVKGIAQLRFEYFLRTGTWPC
jgi:hypothetical protein